MLPLLYPNDYPPTDRWKKFFLGVRWLGPDLRFFGDLKTEQAARVRECMGTWGGGKREEFATVVSRTVAEQLGWKSPFFIPKDSACVVLRGPSFDWSEPQDAIAALNEVMQSQFEVRVPESFWQAHWHLTVGEVVDALLSLERPSARESGVA